MRDEVHGRRLQPAWQLLVRFFFAQRERLPAAGAELDLSPAQWHVLHLIEPGSRSRWAAWPIRWAVTRRT